MSQLPARLIAPAPAPAPALLRRASHIPLDEAVPVQEKSSHYRKDKDMILAFGLENDVLYWDQMKTDGLRICQDELPPKHLSPATRERLNISDAEAEILSYSGKPKPNREFLWKHVTAPWREKYAYDLEYLQRKYPPFNMQDFVCGLFSYWNTGKSFIGLTRSWSEGRDLPETLLQCNSGQLKLKGLPSTTPDSHALTTDTAAVEGAYDSDGYESDLNKSVSRLEVEEPHWGTPENLKRYIQREDDEKAPVIRKSVMLSMRHTDPTKGKIDRIPLRMVCGDDVKSILDLDAKKLEEEMDDQGITASNYLLSLQGSVDAVGSRRTNIVQLLTEWERTRPDDEYDVPLLLIPKATGHDDQLLLSDTNDSHQDVSAPAVTDLKIEKEPNLTPPSNDSVNTKKRTRPESSQLIDDDHGQHKGRKDCLPRQRKATVVMSSTPRITRHRQTRQRAETEDGREGE